MALTEHQALIAYAEMMNTFNSDKFIELLAENFVLTSQFVLEDMTGKDTYANFIKAKFETMRTVQQCVFAEFGEVNAYGHTECVVLAQPTKEDLTVTVFIDVEDEKITQVAMCQIPPPQSVVRSGVYPIPDDFMERMELKGSLLEQIVYVDRNVFYKTFCEAIKKDQALADSIQKLSKKLFEYFDGFDMVYIKSLTDIEIVALIRTMLDVDKSVFDGTLNSEHISSTLLRELKLRNFIHYEFILNSVQQHISKKIDAIETTPFIVNKFREQWNNTIEDGFGSLMPLTIFRVTWKNENDEYFERWYGSEKEAFDKKYEIDHNNELRYINFESWFAYRSDEHDKRFGYTDRERGWWETKLK